MLYLRLRINSLPLTNIKMKKFTRTKKFPLGIIPAVFCAFLAMPFAIAGQTADCKEVFISEYVDGTAKNKALELFNPTDDPINLLGYSVLVYYDGSTEAVGIHLTGSIPAKGVYVLASAEADSAVLGIAQQISADYHPDGNDAIEFRKQNVLLDGIGEPGDDPGPGGWAVGNGSTNDHTLIRRVQCKRGEPDWGLCQAQWTADASQQISGLGDHIGICRNAGGYTIEVTQGLDPSYSEGVCGGSTTGCIPITVTVTPPVSGNDLVWVEIDKNSTCPFPPSTAGIDEKFPAGNDLFFQDGNNGPQTFSLLIIDDQDPEPSENLCLIVSAPPNTCINCEQNTVIIDNDMVGIADLLAKTPLEIGPNPVSDELFIRNLPGIECKAILNVHGKTTQITFQKSGQNYTINLENLPAGIYFLQFEYKGMNYSYKLLRQKY